MNKIKCKIPIALTGATGYLGRRIFKKALQLNFSVISLGRRPLEGSSEHIYWDISHPSVVQLPKECAGVVHLAVNPFASTEKEHELEFQSSVLLLESACQQSVPFFFISSHAAREKAPTPYGRTKWKIERRVLDSGGWVIRLGQVYGGPPGGLFRRLDEGVNRFCILPRFIPDPKIRPIHVDDAATGICNLLGRSHAKGRLLSWGATAPVGFSSFLSLLASERHGKKALFFPFPAFIIRLSLSLVGEKNREIFGINRLLSLLDLPDMDTARDMMEFGVPTRPLQSGLSRSGKGRRGLLREGERFFRHILKSRPKPRLLKRYVKGMESVRDGMPLPLPVGRLSFEVFSSILDAGFLRSTSLEREFRWRMNAAMVLSEATIEGGERFLGPSEGRTTFKVIRILVSALIAELMWRAVAVVARPFSKVFVKHGKDHI